MFALSPFLAFLLAAQSVHAADPIRVRKFYKLQLTIDLNSSFLSLVFVTETNNVDAETALTAVQAYLERMKLPGLSLGNVSRVTLDSTQKFLTVDDGINTITPLK